MTLRNYGNYSKSRQLNELFIKPSLYSAD